MKGYAEYKKIKNDTLSIPITDTATFQKIGEQKKVRLTVKIVKSPNFNSIIEKEESMF